ncbi:MAG: sugar-binding domain-containing protein [Spirochaetales bacterium]|uniref:Sugar-binding domain-containing protein n=1 Tax=Candidatus Thalassospirochaeta sargassi TaxID=3119039 RepID=A0AAJ1IE92_9SPIO|nr:sugar-binding domain-containing protein [Spirochaetales bacterium]
MRNKVDKQLLYNVARMYYAEGKKQDEIAAIVERSRSSISMFLTEARKEGIVEIRLRNPMGNNDELSSLFVEKFALKQCYVVPTAVKNTEMLIRLVAERAIDVFNDLLEEQDTVGVAWGRTCYEFMSQYYNDNDYMKINLAPLIGGSNRPLKRYQMNEIVRDFAEKLSATPHFIHAPAIADSEDDLNLYKSSAMMKRISSLWNELNIAVIAIGLSAFDSALGETGNLTSRLAHASEFEDSVGDICGWPISEDGEFISGPTADLLLGCTPDQLRATEKVLGLVAGIEKKYSIIAGLKTGILDYLVIDEQTAKAVAKLI